MKLDVLLGLFLLTAALMATAQDAGDPTTSDDPVKEGRALAAKVVAAMGGEARLKAIHSLRAKIRVTQRTTEGEVPVSMVATLVFPDRMHVDMATPDGPVTFVVTSNSGFRVTGSAVQDLPQDQRNEMLRQIKRDIIYMAQRVSDPAFTARASGKQTVGEVEATALDLRGPGISMRWFVDAQTGHLAGEAYMVETRVGAYQSTTLFSDWKSVDGVTLPHKHLDTRGGITTSWAEFKSIEFNPPISSALFDRPVARKPEVGNSAASEPKKP